MAQDHNDNLHDDYREYGRLHGFGWLGVLVILAFIGIAFVAYYGYTGPGLFSVESAIAGLSAGLIILTFAVLILLFSIRSLVARGRDQAAQVAILRAQAYAHGLEMQHAQKPHNPQVVQEVTEPKFVENVVVNVEATPTKPAGVTTARPTTIPPTVSGHPGTWSCEALEGIGETFAARLRAQGITTVSDLRSARVKRIAEAADVNEYIAAHWRSMAELVMIPEIGPQEAEVLARTGVHNPRVLAHHEPRTLFAACKYVVEGRKNNIYPGEIDVSTVRGWINAARVYVRSSSQPTGTSPATRSPGTRVAGT